mmetsp:Transcript_24850/g.39010  ORF Transcript_24850/g.39010 Transcript_24850/m.39010 type:complete len:131 (-) Transcript_24850:176-568(-)
MIKRKLVDCGILMQDHDLERVLEFYRSVFTQKIQLRKFIEDVDPGAYDHIFPTHKIVSAADLQKVKKEKALASSETDGEVRNLFRSVAAKGRDFQTSNSMTLGGLSGSNESRIAESDTALQDGFAQEGQS